MSNLSERIQDLHAQAEKTRKSVGRWAGCTALFGTGEVVGIVDPSTANGKGLILMGIFALTGVYMVATEGLNAIQQGQTLVALESVQAQHEFAPLLATDPKTTG